MAQKSQNKMALFQTFLWGSLKGKFHGGGRGDFKSPSSFGSRMSRMNGLNGTLQIERIVLQKYKTLKPT